MCFLNYDLETRMKENTCQLGWEILIFREEIKGGEKKILEQTGKLVVKNDVIRKLEGKKQSLKAA